MHYSSPGENWPETVSKVMNKMKVTMVTEDQDKWQEFAMSTEENAKTLAQTQSKQMCMLSNYGN